MGFQNKGWDQAKSRLALFAGKGLVAFNAILTVVSRIESLSFLLTNSSHVGDREFTCVFHLCARPSPFKQNYFFISLG
jgi:hypothetical protein